MLSQGFSPFIYSRRHLYALLRNYPLWENRFLFLGTLRRWYIYTDTFLHKVDHILLIINSIENNIQFTYETKNNGILLLLDKLVSRSDEGFSISVYRKNFVSQHHMLLLAILVVHKWPHFTLLLIVPLTYPISFHTEIRYLKAIAFGRGYNPPIVAKITF